MIHRSVFVFALGFVFALPLLAQDFTPPVLTPNISGTAGNHGWYTSDVAVSWTMTDDESDVIVLAGCEPLVVTNDTAGETVFCSALSLGGIATSSYTIRRDATAPVITYANAKATYELGETVTIFCNAFDAVSGVATSDCQDIIGPASLFAATNVFMATATDAAGNRGSATIAFSILTSAASLGTLADQWVTNEKDARNLRKRLERGDIDGFIRNVQREIGRSVSLQHGLELIRLARTLL